MNNMDQMSLKGGATLAVSMRRRGEASEKYRAAGRDDPGIGWRHLQGDGDFSNPALLEVVVANDDDVEWAGIIHFEWEFTHPAPDFFLPAFMYGDNHAGHPKGQYPRLRRGPEEPPRSPYWMVRSDRLSHPVAMAYGSGMAFGIAASPYLIRRDGWPTAWLPGLVGPFVGYNGFSCALKDGKASVGYTLGYENAPVLHISNSLPLEPRHPLVDKAENCLVLGAGERMEFQLLLFAAGGEDPRCVNNIVRTVYGLYHQEPRRQASPRDALLDLATAVDTDGYLPEFKNYSTQVFRKGDPVVRVDPKRLAQETDGFYFQAIPSIAWTGGLACAVPQLLAAFRLGDEGMRAHALEAIGHVVANSLNPKSGLPFDAYDVKTGAWSTRGWWSNALDNPGHSSYLVGQALFYLLKAFQYEERFADATHEDWLDFAARSLERIRRTMSPKGEFPYLWSAEDGKPLEWDAMSGCWCLAALVLYAQITKDADLIEELRESEAFYHAKFVSKMQCYGTPHDTFKAMDNEGILAYIRATKILHEETGEDGFLAALVDGLEYEFTWKFAYNSPVQIPPLSELGWHSSGGSVTSTCNPHIHPMSNSVLDELLHAWRATGDPYLLARLKDTLLWGLQTYNTKDGEYGFGKKGWMSERFCYSQGLLEESYPDGSPASTWFCYLPWAAAGIIEGVAGELWGQAERLLLPDAPEE